MPAKVFIDTNIVIYALGPASDKTSVVAPLLVGRPTISTQVIIEVASVASKRLAMPLSEIRRLLSTLETICQVELVTPKTIYSSLDIMDRYRFSWFDSLIFAAAIEAGCNTLFTKDLQHGQVISSQLTICNPFLSIT
jgi:predicted nucleic acid-binding protein